MSMWVVFFDCVGRRDPPSAVCDSCVDNGFAPSLGLRAPRAFAPFRCNVWRTLDAAKHRGDVVDNYENRCDPTLARKDIFMVCPWVAELRQAPPADMRGALQQVKRHLAPANTFGPKDVVGQGSDAPPDGASLSLLTAQFSGPGSQAEKVAMESVGRIILSCAPHMKYKYRLPNNVQSMG